MQNAWDERYLAKDLVWGLAPNQFVVSILNDFPPGRVLDLACGEGRNSIWLAEKGHEVTATDISGVAIDRAIRLAAEAGVAVHFERADALEVDLGVQAYDLILLSYLQVSPDARVAIHGKVVAALAPGGRVVLVAHHRDNIENGYGGPQDPSVCFTEAELAADFADLDIERNESVIRIVETDDGTHEAIDILVIARRSAL